MDLNQKNKISRNHEVKLKSVSIIEAGTGDDSENQKPRTPIRQPL